MNCLCRDDLADVIGEKQVDKLGEITLVALGYSEDETCVCCPCMPRYFTVSIGYKNLVYERYVLILRSTLCYTFRLFLQVPNYVFRHGGFLNIYVVPSGNRFVLGE